MIVGNFDGDAAIAWCGCFTWPGFSWRVPMSKSSTSFASSFREGLGGDGAIAGMTGFCTGGGVVGAGNRFSHNARDFSEQPTFCH